MSTLSNPMPAIDPRCYDAVRAEWLALQFASGEPGTDLPSLHRAFPDTVPPPMFVRRWRSVFPAFDALMAEAETARACALMDDTIRIADDVQRNAAQAKNAITARWRMSEALAPEIFGARSAAKSPGDDDTLTLRGRLTDAMLMRIIAGAEPRALLQHDPTNPPLPPAVSSDGANDGSEARPPPCDIHSPGPSIDEPQSA